MRQLFSDLRQQFIWLFSLAVAFLFGYLVGAPAWDDWTSPAVIVALFALLLTFFQIRATQMHNRLSVRPLLLFRSPSGETDDRRQFISISLSNEGLGPAIVSEFHIYCNGEVLSAIDIEDLLSKRSGLWDLYQAHKVDSKSQAMGVNNGFHIKDGATHEVLRIEFWKEDSSISDEKLWEVRNKISTIIQGEFTFGGSYSSIYRDKKITIEPDNT